MNSLIQKIVFILFFLAVTLQASGNCTATSSQCFEMLSNGNVKISVQYVISADFGGVPLQPGFNTLTPSAIIPHVQKLVDGNWEPMFDEGYFQTDIKYSGVTVDSVTYEYSMEVSSTHVTDGDQLRVHFMAHHYGTSRVPDGPYLYSAAFTVNGSVAAGANCTAISNACFNTSSDGSVTVISQFELNSIFGGYEIGNGFNPQTPDIIPHVQKKNNGIWVPMFDEGYFQSTIKASGVAIDSNTYQYSLTIDTSHVEIGDTLRVHFIGHHIGTSTIPQGSYVYSKEFVVGNGSFGYIKPSIPYDSNVTITFPHDANPQFAYVAFTDLLDSTKLKALYSNYTVENFYSRYANEPVYQVAINSTLNNFASVLNADFGTTFYNVAPINIKKQLKQPPEAAQIRELYEIEIHFFNSIPSLEIQQVMNTYTYWGGSGFRTVMTVLMSPPGIDSLSNEPKIRMIRYLEEGDGDLDTTKAEIGIYALRNDSFALTTTSEYTGLGITVGIHEKGISFDHPDLGMSRLLSGYDRAQIYFDVMISTGDTLYIKDSDNLKSNDILFVVPMDSTDTTVFVDTVTLKFNPEVVLGQGNDTIELSDPYSFEINGSKMEFRAYKDDWPGTFVEGGKSNHGTEVTGIVGGTGHSSIMADSTFFGFEQRGIAPMVQFNSEWTKFGLDKDRGHVTNHSHGYGTSQFYDKDYAAIDNAIRNNSFNDSIMKVLVTSAGNTGSNNDTSSEGDDPRGYYSAKTFKNVIVVGNYDSNSDSLNPGGIVRPASAKGPTLDGRIKPDIVAPGSTTISTSCIADSTFLSVINDPCNFTYSDINATSAAAPHVTGVVALLMQKYRNTILGCPIDGACPALDTNNWQSSTYRGILIHTATDMILSRSAAQTINDSYNPDLDHATQGVEDNTFWGPGPDFATGWGLINAEKAIEQVDNSITLEKTVGHEEELEFTFTPSDSKGLRFTIAWDDAAPLNNKIEDVMYSKLVNDIDMYVVAPGGDVYYPWRIDPYFDTTYTKAIDWLDETDVDSTWWDVITPVMVQNNSAYNNCSDILNPNVFERDCFDKLNNVEVIDIRQADIIGEIGVWVLKVRATVVGSPSQKISIISDYPVGALTGCLVGNDTLALTNFMSTYGITDPISDVATFNTGGLLKTLNLQNEGIDDVEMLKCFSGLEVLKLSDNEIVDVAPLAQLTLLDTLVLSYNDSLTDISPLDPLINLKLLDLRGCYISNWGSPIADIVETNIEIIDSITPIDTSIVDTSTRSMKVKIPESRLQEFFDHLVDFPHMTDLDLGVNNYYNVSGIAVLKHLERLAIDSNNIRNLDFILELPNLKELKVSGNKVCINRLDELDTDLKDKLDTIAIDNYYDQDGGSCDLCTDFSNDRDILDSFIVENKIDTINFPVDTLFSGADLVELGRDSVIVDPYLLMCLENIEELNMTGSGIASLSFVKNMSSLRELGVRSSYLYNIAPINNLSNLGRLNLTNNPLDELSSADFSFLPNLHTILILQTYLDDLDELRDAINLQTIHMDGMVADTIDITGLDSLPSLGFINRTPSDTVCLDPAGAPYDAGFLSVVGDYVDCN